ncbi:MAG TPA: hypothetical protein VGH53_20630 [Streptosporangiaceae bacterium]
MAKAIAQERAADFIRAAEANRKARDGAQPGARRRPGWGRPHGHARAAMLCQAGR